MKIVKFNQKETYFKIPISLIPELIKLSIAVCLISSSLRKSK
jgi:hypothetical protein